LPACACAVGSHVISPALHFAVDQLLQLPDTEGKNDHE
jgi:hypothetical protein